MADDRNLSERDFGEKEPEAEVGARFLSEGDFGQKSGRATAGGRNLSERDFDQKEPEAEVGARFLSEGDFGQKSGRATAGGRNLSERDFDQKEPGAEVGARFLSEGDFDKKAVGALQRSQKVGGRPNEWILNHHSKRSAPGCSVIQVGGRYGRKRWKRLTSRKRRSRLSRQNSVRRFALREDEDEAPGPIHR